MIQNWKKRGLVFCPTGEREWMHSHAALPIVEPIGGDFFRVYFTVRNARNQSHGAYVVIDINRPQVVQNISQDPVVTPGSLGLFDDSGAMPIWLTRAGGKRYLFYTGWNVGVTVPFRTAIGLATSGDDQVFHKYAEGPLLDRTLQEPYPPLACCVLLDGSIWRMWYVSCTDWRLRGGQPQHRYHIKYAESSDGVIWNRTGHVAIDYKDDGEYAIARPCVIRDADCWKMWFSYRGEAYRIGYAESPDGLSWTRLDDRVGITVSSDGWDSDMVEYPFVFDHKGQRFMLYNGNDYGRTGFGLAVLE